MVQLGSVRIFLPRNGISNQRCVPFRVKLQPIRTFMVLSRLNRQTEEKNSTINNVKEDTNFLGLIAKQFKERIYTGHTLASKYSGQFAHQWGEVKEALQIANKKFKDQEAEEADSKLNYNRDVVTGGKIGGLPSEKELHRRKWSRKLELYLDSLQETIFSASKAFNDVTGYSGIQKLRSSIEVLQINLEIVKKEVKSLKLLYAETIELRTNSQRQVNELLQRKSTWSSNDLDHFTQLYKDDATNLKTEQEMKEQVAMMEEKQERLTEELYSAILTRYHEEQIWSDKIRRTSGWSTFMLMGMNLVLFLILQLFLEPWKRRRLTGSFENKVKQALDEHGEENNSKLEYFAKDLNSQIIDALNKDRMKKQLMFPNVTLESLTLKNVWLWIRQFGLKLNSINLTSANAETKFSTLEIYFLVSSIGFVSFLISTFT